MSHRWGPLRDLFRLEERMNSLFEEAARQRTAGGEEERSEMGHADWQPAADVYESEKDYLIALDLPGVRRQGLEVSLDENQLTISGERDRGAEDTNPRRSERPFGRFSRSFTLPAVVDREGITADYKDGVLRLRLPKRSGEQGRRVEIKVS
ncbi:MAG: Hsp20/alpha crystallin family protein [Pyrinomonadaceae bacterium]